MKRNLLACAFFMVGFADTKILAENPKASEEPSATNLKERVTLLEARLNRLENQLLTIKSCQCSKSTTGK